MRRELSMYAMLFAYAGCAGQFSAYFSPHDCYVFSCNSTICWCSLLRSYHIGDVSVSLKSDTVGLGAPPISLFLAHLIRFHCRAIIYGRVARESDIVATRVSTRDLRRRHVLRRISFATACNAFVIRRLYTTGG